MAARLYAQAVEQNDIIFEQPGLKVYAALITKLDQLWHLSLRSYDLNDTVAYLNMVTSKGDTNNPVHMKQLRAWATEFGLVVPGVLLIDGLGKAYAQKYKSNGITL